MVTKPLALGPLKLGSRVGTNGLVQNKMPRMKTPSARSADACKALFYRVSGNFGKESSLGITNWAKYVQKTGLANSEQM